jgi:hypothetical protein
VIRTAHRSIAARLFALCLLALAVSPLTAPFSAVASCDYGRSQPAEAHHHHPAHDMAEAHHVTSLVMITVSDHSIAVVDVTSRQVVSSASAQPLVQAQAIGRVLRL